MQYDFDPYFLSYLLNHENLRKFARQTAQPVISNSSLSNVILKFPKSKIEQLEIASVLKGMDYEVYRLISLYTYKQVRYEELKKSVLAKAFAGEL
jgi:type I restriction enzyme S subunit